MCLRSTGHNNFWPIFTIFGTIIPFLFCNPLEIFVSQDYQNVFSAFLGVSPHPLNLWVLAMLNSIFTFCQSVSSQLVYTGVKSLDFRWVFKHFLNVIVGYLSCFGVSLKCILKWVRYTSSLLLMTKNRRAASCERVKPGPSTTKTIYPLLSTSCFTFLSLLLVVAVHNIRQLFCRCPLMNTLSLIQCGHKTVSNTLSTVDT